MKIAIIGAGNIGTLLAAELACKGHSIKVRSSKPSLWADEIKVVDYEGNVICKTSQNIFCSDKYDEILDKAQYVFITTPAFMFKEISTKIEQYIEPGMVLVIVPSNGGAEYYFENCQKKGCILAGLERVHANSRLVKYGSSVRVLSRRSVIKVGTIPNFESNKSKISNDLSEMLDIKCEILSNYLSASMAPSNPILHTPRLYTLLRESNEKDFEKIPKMYEDWEDESSRLLFLLDEELQRICESLKRLDLTSVPSLREYYESPTVEKFTEKMHNIKAFKGAEVPMYTNNGCLEFDFQHRWFRADFEYSLSFIRDIGRITGVATPVMNEILSLYTKKSGFPVPIYFENYTTEDLYNLYIKGIYR